MSTPTKPERVEVQVGQRRQHPTAGIGPFVILSVGDLCRIRYENTGNEYSVAALLLEDRPLVAPSPATPGTATVAPAVTFSVACPRCDWRSDGWNNQDAARWALKGHDREHASKPPASPALQPRPHPADLLPPKPPVYGRLVGELRAPDGTPRTALEAIRAKREPERWRPSVDEWDLLPDVDVRR